ncbi:response regulator [Flavihumibacter sp. CACIAM 22H1]|uniref:response regulator n=1 Tax=Flavihumibacter sp. CACIAM 22H1 TaxID=1812911 RepID=UPI0007A830FB|nr:response regulator [Flavihumibacter sp. CACIAM 22H1]KYP16210.1 MAG: hypothetical protein A1D16_14235 [Flavihumibacter sp. CACIAM 22H1]
MKRKVLVITASKSIRFLLHTVLNDQFSAITASEAGDAMYWLTRSELPAAIVVDPELPDSNTWEIVEYFKTSELYKNIPMVVISSLEEEEIATVCTRYNVEAAFHKPFNPVDLTKTLEALIKSPVTSSKKLLKVV